MEVEKPLRPDGLLKRYRELEVKHESAEVLLDGGTVCENRISGVTQRVDDSGLLLKKLKSDNELVGDNVVTQTSALATLKHFLPSPTIDTDKPHLLDTNYGDNQLHCTKISPEEQSPRIERPRAQYVSTATTSASFQDNLSLLHKLLAKQRMKCSSASTSPNSGLGVQEPDSSLTDLSTVTSALPPPSFPAWPWLTGPLVYPGLLKRLFDPDDRTGKEVQ
ncbi:unnamed protein product [Toxocara canis]|uniref:Uncharacterized protein n=1 Tax=Toxocara canis TaxID=6265 RepID=A0A183UWG7_TOXCA|nr:unnamed protein product [Toxocara canis]